MELHTKDKRVYLISDEEAVNLQKAAVAAGQMGRSQLVKLRNGTMIATSEIRLLQRSPESDPTKLIGGKTEWQLREEQYEREKSTKKRKLVMVNGVPQFVIE